MILSCSEDRHLSRLPRGGFSDFRGEMKDALSLQEQNALKIAQSLNPKHIPQEEEAIRHRYKGNPQACDAFLRGQARMQYPDQPEKLEAARRACEESLTSDPNYPPALAGLAWVEAQIYRNVDSTPALTRRRWLSHLFMDIGPSWVVCLGAPASNFVL